MQRHRDAGRTVKTKHSTGEWLSLILSHAAIVLAGMYLVLYILDHYDRSKPMNFIGNEITKGLILALGFIAGINAVRALLEMHRRSQLRAKRAQKAPGAAQPQTPARSAARTTAARPATVQPARAASARPATAQSARAASARSAAAQPARTRTAQPARSAESTAQPGTHVSRHAAR